MLGRALWGKRSLHGLLLLHGSPAFPSQVYSSLICLIFVLLLVCSLCKAHNIAELRCCRKYQKKFNFQHYLVYFENNPHRNHWVTVFIFWIILVGPPQLCRYVFNLCMNEHMRENNTKKKDHLVLKEKREYRRRLRNIQCTLTLLSLLLTLKGRVSVLWEKKMHNFLTHNIRSFSANSS